MTYIPVILGTARKGRQSERVARLFIEQATLEGIETEILDAREFAPPATDNTLESQKAKEFSKKIEKAHALVIVSPEYNHSYPGELKLMLDMAYTAYEGKKAGLVGVSVSTMGGARAIQQLKLLCLAYKMDIDPYVVYFPEVGQLFESQDTRPYKRRASKLLKSLSA